MALLEMSSSVKGEHYHGKSVANLLADTNAEESKRQALYYLGKFEAYVQRLKIAADLDELMTLRKNDPDGAVSHWEIMRDFVKDDQYEMKGIAFTSRKNAGTVIRRWYETNNLPIQSRKVVFARDLKNVGKADVGNTTIADVRALLLDGQPSPMMKAIILIQLQSGMGRSEVMRSFAKDGLEQLMRGTWRGQKYWSEPLGEDVSTWTFEGKTPYPVNVIRVKTGDKFYTFLSKDALEAVKFYLLDREARQGRKLRPTDALFAERRNLTKIDQNLRAIAERAKVNDYVEAGRVNQRRYRVHLHGIRGLFNTVCDNAGIADKFTEFMLGHEWQKYNYSHAPYQTDENSQNIGLERFREEYRKAEPRFNLLSNPNGSVAVNRIARLEDGLKERDERIIKLEKEVAGLTRIADMYEDLKRVADLEKQLEPDPIKRAELLKKLT